MSKKRITLCACCYNLLKTQRDIQPVTIEGAAVYTATGYCSECRKRGSVRRYEVAVSEP